MTDLDNGLLHQPLNTQIKAAHQLRARYIASLIRGLLDSVKGSKHSSGNAPTKPGQSAA
ncbi:MAG: hypothetical protein AAGC96_06530 [Pseudomonadota bacterium]